MSLADSFRAARWIRTANLVLQAILFTTLFSGLNYLAIHYAWRHDLTQHRRHSLSPETRSYLTNLRADVEVIVTLTDDPENNAVAQAYRDVRGLLREYVYATAGNEPVPGSGTGSGRVTVRYLDVFRQRREAEAAKVEQPNAIVVVCGERRRNLGLEELYRFENREKRAFRGEQALTAAILDVNQPEPTRIYFLMGHGEMRADDTDAVRGLSALRDELRARNFELLGIDLAQSRRIPEDAALLIIAAPQGPYDPFEVELLRSWMTRSPPGRLLVMLAPGYRHGLEPLLSDWGLVADDVVVHDEGPAGQNESGDLILRSLSKESPITAVLLANEIPVRFGTARAARPDPRRDRNAGIDVKPLVATTDTAWGERSFRSPAVSPFRHWDRSARTGGDRRLRRTRGPPKDNVLPFSVRGGRIVLFGGADFVANGRLANAGNIGLFLNAVNWVADRDTQLNIPRVPSNATNCP